MFKKQEKMYKHSLANFLTIITVACFLFSCDKNTVYSEYQHIRNKTWNKQDEYFFSFIIKDNTVAYNISLLLRNNDMYPYQNIWLFHDELQPSETSVKDTVEFSLADDFGKWKGKGFSLFQNQITIKNNYLFTDTGKYTIGIRHGMRNDELKGIEDIGLLIEKSQ